MLSTKGGTPFEVRTIDIASGGLCIHAGLQLQPGQRYLLSFEILLNGSRGRVSAVAEVVYCTYGGNDQFKAGLRFLHMSAESGTVINTFMST